MAAGASFPAWEVPAWEVPARMDQAHEAGAVVYSRSHKKHKRHKGRNSITVPLVRLVVSPFPLPIPTPVTFINVWMYTPQLI